MTTNPTILRAACTLVCGCTQAEFLHAKSSGALLARAAYAAHAMTDDMNTAQALARVGWSLCAARKYRLRFRKLPAAIRCRLRREIPAKVAEIERGLEVLDAA